MRSLLCAERRYCLGNHRPPLFSVCVRHPIALARALLADVPGQPIRVEQGDPGSLMGIALQPEGLPRPSSPYSPVVVSGENVFTAGQVGFDENGDLVPGAIQEQTRQALENVRTCLAAAGCTMADVVKVTAFLVDLGDFAAYNEVYAEFFTEPYPARTTVGVMLPDGLLVEIEAVARIP